jgi:Na+-transporting methylmalonyl-CoA/oxaloacetate decarboxylase gamma subunit
MRTIVLSILALAIYSVSLVAVQAPADPKPAEPTAEQLAAELKELKNLAYVLLLQTKVTDEGVKQLQEALPNCKITRYAGGAVAPPPGQAR